MPAVTYSGADGVMLTSSVTLGREWGVGHGVGGERGVVDRMGWGSAGIGPRALLTAAF